MKGNNETAAYDCVLERRRLDDLLNGTEVWHIAKYLGRTQDFTPIRCSKTEGITMPGPIVRRVPTCPECLRTVPASPGGSR